MERKRLKDIAIVEYGKSPKGIRTELSDIPIYGTSGQVGYSKKTLFKGPLTVIARKGTLNNPIYSPNDCWIIDTAYAVIVNDDCDAKWLYYNFFNFDLTSLNEATGVPSINRNALYNITFHVPPLPEQTKIADILTTVDDKISSIDSQIQQTEQLKKGLMEKLLTEGIGHTEFKETEIGKVPVGWDVKPLGSIGEFLKGKGIAKKDLVENGLPCVRYGEIYTVHHWIIKSFYSFISKETASQSKEIKKNDLLFAGSGETVEEIGKAVAYLFHDKAYAGGDIIILRPNNVDSAFISACLNTKKSNKQKRKLGQGNSVVHIYSTGLKQLLIPIPPLQEQKQIATILSTVDDKLDILTQKKSHYQTLKKGLSQQLLTGQMRVKV